MSTILVLGGTRSGKSAFGEKLLADQISQRPTADQISQAEPTTAVYIATAELRGDADFDVRIAKHKHQRPSDWVTYELETPDDIFALLETAHPLIIDSIGTWIIRYPDFEADVDRLVTSLAARSAISIIISEEVGLSVHPTSRLGRAFTDSIGTANIELSSISSDVYLCVAGNALKLKGS